MSLIYYFRFSNNKGQRRISDFRSDDSFPVKTEGNPTEMVDPSFDAEYPTFPSLVEVSGP